MQAYLRTVMLGAAALVLAGCATLAPSRGLGVSVVNALPTATSLFETSLALTLRVTNESGESRSFAGSAHRLYVDDTYIGRAVSNQPLAVPALSTATQTVTVHLENLALLRKASQYQTQAPATVGYRVQSEFYPTGGRGRIAAETTGQVDLAALMAGGGAGAFSAAR